MEETATGGLVKGFRMIWAIVKLNLLFIAFTFAGGVVFGVGPAFYTISSLIETYGLAYEEQTFRRGWHMWKTGFWRANKQFYLFFAVAGFLMYNLYLATQIQGLIWLVISFVLIVVIGLCGLLYFMSVTFDACYEISFGNNLKLSFICLFLRMGTFLKLIFGLIGIAVITWTMKGLFLFGTFSLMMLWVHGALRPERQLIERDLTDA
ncbi:YesL family protein [Enterococcus sp. DIV0876]|uniref:YesL family protein n=1 Tax=Enterococcus sp. DIV0876 TaxID=2774633 RepID=UPI003D2FA5A8